MAIKVGELFVSLGLSTASFAKSINDVTKLTAGSAKEIERSLKIVGNTVVAMSTGAVTALGYLVKKQIDVADAALKMSQKFGVSVEALTGLGHAADLAGIDTQTLGAGLKNLTKWMVENGQGARDVKEVLFEVAEGYARMGEGAARSADAQKKFGKAGADLIPMLKGGRAELRANVEEAERLGLVIDTKTAVAAGAFNDNLTRLKGILTGVATQVMTANVPALAALSEAFFEVNVRAAQAGDELLDGFLPKLLLMLETARGRSEDFVDWIKGIALGVHGLATGNIGEVTAAGILLGPEMEFSNEKRRVDELISFLLDSQRKLEEGLRQGRTRTKLIDLAPVSVAGATATEPKKIVFSPQLGRIKDWETLQEAVRAYEKAAEEAAIDAAALELALTLQPEVLADWGALPGTIAGVGDAAIQIAKPMSDLQREMIEKMRQFSESSLSAIGDAALGLTSWKNVAQQIIADLGRMLFYMLVIKPLMNAIFKLGGGGGGIGMLPISPPSGMSSLMTLTPGRALGGPVFMGQPVMVGERGPELFLPSSNGQIIPNGQVAGARGGVTIHNEIDARGADFGTVMKISAVVAQTLNARAIAAMLDRQSRVP